MGHVHCQSGRLTGYTVVVPRRQQADCRQAKYSPCAASLAEIPPGGLGLSGLVHEKAHPNTSKSI